MTKLYNINNYKQIRRNLRKQEIAPEKILWYKLRNRYLGYKFRRQYGVNNYILDFYCPELKFAIEIDGATHGAEKEIDKDNIRQAYIESLGIKINRYFNSDIYKNIDDVVDHIAETCKKIKNEKPPLLHKERVGVR